MVHDVDAEGAGQLGHLDLVGQEEPPVHGQAHQRAGLRAKVFGHVGQVDFPAPGLKNPPVMLVVEIEDVAQQGVGHLRPQGQVLHRRFQAAQIAVQQERLVNAAVDGPVAVILLDRPGDRRVVELVAGRPAVGVNLRHAPCAGQRLKVRLQVGAPPYETER